VGLTKARAVLALCAFAWVACLVVRLFNVGHYGTFRPPYPDTALRMAPYVCGVAAGVFVHEDERHRTAQGPKIAPTPFRFQLLGVWLSGVVLAFGALVGGGEPGYLVDNAEFGHWYVHAHHKLALLHAALLRPMISLATTYLLLLAVTDRSPGLSRFLSLSWWRPLAGLSYSMYLLQYAGGKLLFVPMLRGFHSWASERAGPDIGPWLLLSSCIVVQGLALVAIVGTVPVAFLNYAIVERPGMLAGRHLLARFADSPQAASTRNGLLAVVKPQEVMAAEVALAARSPKSGRRCRPSFPLSCGVYSAGR